MYLRQGLEDGGSHERIINSNDENTTGILKFGVIDISWNMRVTAPRAYREISSRTCKVVDWSDAGSIIRGRNMHRVTY
jgi:hypothetical protein